MFCFLAAINSIDFFEEEYFDRRRKGSERAGVKFNRRRLWKFSGKNLLKVLFWRSSDNHKFWEMKKVFRHINWTLRHQSNILPCRTKKTPIKCRDLSSTKSPLKQRRIFYFEQNDNRISFIDPWSYRSAWTHSIFFVFDFSREKCSQQPVSLSRKLRSFIWKQSDKF